MEPTFNVSKASSNSDDNDVMNVNQDVDHQAASVACVIEEEVLDEAMSGKDVEALPLYNVRQKETVDDVIVNPQLSAEQRNQVKDLLIEYKEVFSDVPGVTHLVGRRVELTESEPVKGRPCPVPCRMREVIDKEIEDMLAMGVIERSGAPYASPLVLVKKPDGSYRVCVNFKDLNGITVFDPGPMMSPDDVFPRLSGGQFYSAFDFCGGYWAVPMAGESGGFAAFVASGGLVRFRVMPFGVVDSGSTCGRMVGKLLEGARDIESCVGDVLGHTTDWSRRVQMLGDFFERVRGADLCLRPSGCRMGFGTVDFLGRTMRGGSVGPRVESVVKSLILSDRGPRRTVAVYSGW